MYEVIGLVGTGLAAAAHVPQVVLLIQTRDSTGVSLRSWSMWFVATSCIMLTAHTGNDVVFKEISTSNWMFAVIILSLVFAFKPGRKLSKGRFRY